MYVYLVFLGDNIDVDEIRGVFDKKLGYDIIFFFSKFFLVFNSQ